MKKISQTIIRMELWLNNSLNATYLIVFYVILLKFYQSKIDYNLIHIQLNILIYIVLFIIIYFIKIKKTPITLPPKIKKGVLLISILFVIYFILQIMIIKTSPNPGYGYIVIYSDSILIVLLSYLIFKSHLTKKSFIYILVILCGLGIVMINSY